MKMNQNIAQKIATSTTLTATVQQALKVLQMTNLELTDYLQQQALDNPFLVVTQPNTDVPLPNTSTNDEPWKENWETGCIDYSKDDEGPLWEKTLAQHTDLNQLIVSQIHSTFPLAHERKVALILFGLLDERGFLTVDLPALATCLHQDLSTIHRVLTRLKTLEPAGILAADWKESVLLQLEDMGYDLTSHQLVLTHFQDILQGKISKVRTATGLPEDVIYKALKHIRHINPYPLRPNDEDTTVQLKIPDIFVEKEESGGWMILLNPDTLPKALADRDYYHEVKGICQTEDEKSFVKDGFQNAVLLVKAMDQRCQNILKISTALVTRQESFLDHGTKFLSPMTLKDIATDVSVHESTVSRAISNKYIQTPQGTFPLKYFFTTSISGSFQDYSAESIRNQIRHMIENETAVLSDDKIAEMLNHLGIDIARRTVTKYRESMSIPSSTERRRIKKITSAI